MGENEPQKGLSAGKKKIAIIAIATVVVTGIALAVGQALNSDGDSNPEQSEKSTRFVSGGWDSYDSLNSLTARSIDIVTGKITGIKAVNEGGPLLSTDYYFQVDRAIKGDLSSGDTIVIRQPGAELENEIVVIEDDPLIRVGDEYLVFLSYSTEVNVYPILGGPQGRFITQDGLVNSVDTVYGRAAWVFVKVHDRDLDQFVQEVRMEMATQSPLASSAGYTLSWGKEVRGTFTVVNISDDKSFLALGSGSGDKEGAIYMYNSNNGDLLWKYDADRRISSIKIPSDGSHLGAAGFQFSGGPAKIYTNGSIYYFDANTGQLLWSRTTGSEPVTSFLMSSDGSYLAVGTGQNILYYDSEGRLLWNQTIDGSLDGMTLSSDGAFVFAAASSIGQPSNPVEEWGGYLLDGGSGEVLWSYRGAEATIAQTPTMSYDGKYVVVGAALSGYNGFVYYFDRESGELLWKHQINSPALSASLSSDGSALVVSTNWAILYFDGRTGNLLWNSTATGVAAPNPSQLKMTPDGRYVVGCVWGGGTGKDIQLLDPKGNLLWSYPAGTVYSIDISDDGSIIAASASSAFPGDWQNSPTAVYLFQRQDRF